MMDHLDIDYTKLSKEELSNLDTLIIQIYRRITATQYMKDMKISEFVHYTKVKTNKIIKTDTNISQLSGAVYFVKGLISLALRFETFESFENRFERFLTLYFKKILPILDAAMETTIDTSETSNLDFFIKEWAILADEEIFSFIQSILLKIKYDVWQNWLQNPTLEGYKKIQNSLKEDERRNSIAYILPLLKEHLYSPPLQRTYLNILLYEGLKEEIARYMLHFEHQPLLLTDEKKSILKQLEKENSELVLPVYHQFIVRLIEKRTRAHYVEAVLYMKKLQKIYNLLKDTESFHHYVLLMKQNYKSYRALIQEMKKLDPIVQSK